MTSLKPISLTESSPARQLWLELLILAGVALVPLSAKWVIAGIYVTTTQMFFSAAVGLWAVWVLRHRRWADWTPAPGLRWLEWAMLAFLLACAVSGLAAVSKKLWAKELIQIGHALAIYLFVRSVAGQGVRLKTYIAMLLLVAALAGAFGVAQYFSDTPGFAIILGRTRSHLTFGGPNNFAAYLAGAVPLALAAAEQSRRRWLCLAGAGAVTAGLICTCSRSGWIGAFVGLAVVLMLRRRRLLVPVVILLAIMVAQVAAFSYDIRRCGTDFWLSVAGPDANSLSASPVLFRSTDSWRINLFRLGMAMVQSHPLLGVGLGNSRQVMPEYYQKAHVSNRFLVDYANKNNEEMTLDCAPLQIVAELGLLSVTGLALTIGFVVTMTRAYRRGDAKDRPLVAGLIGACIAVLTASLMGWLFTRGVAETFFLLLGLIGAHVLRPQALDRGTSKP
jgi:O-antigen ligase